MSTRTITIDLSTIPDPILGSLELEGIDDEEVICEGCGAPLFVAATARQLDDWYRLPYVMCPDCDKV